ncbi:hypothetical protein [Sphingomonas crusticola]|uniref:hypothetical protein n=1 Tax=Sphingomonas crusticola TaxID=1697973 RepID=UPI000E240827|nr:hypothetical protein [Sphingomonas crusticola]
MANAAERARTDIPTVIAIAAVAGVVATQLHEAVGHGGACIALGRHVREWGAFYLDCDTHSSPPIIGRLVAAAGSTMNLWTAIFAFAALRITPVSWPRARFFWWLLMAVSGMQWAGYFLFSGISGIGDWGAGEEGVFHLVDHWPVWRALLAVGGGLLYWRWAVWCVRRLAGLTGADEEGRHQARRLAAFAYWTIGGSAFVIGLINPVGLFVLLASAVASSFGGPSGLLWAPNYIRAGSPAAPPLVVARSWVWIAAAVAIVLVEGLILGPSLRF